MVGIYLDVEVARRLRGKGRDEKITVSSYVNRLLTENLAFNREAGLEEWLQGANITLVVTPALLDILEDDNLNIWRQSIERGLIARFVLLNPSGSTYINLLREYTPHIERSPGIDLEELNQLHAASVHAFRSLVAWAGSDPRGIRGAVEVGVTDFVPFDFIEREISGEVQIRIGLPSLRSPFSNNHLLTVTRGNENFAYFRGIGNRMLSTSTRLNP